MDKDAQRFARQSQPAGLTAGVIAAICLAEILGLAGYSIVPALLPQFIGEWSLTNAQGGWLIGMVFAGYVLGVLPLVGLTDHIPARAIYLASCVLSALACFGVAISNGFLPALCFRTVSGFALAGMYMPGLRALTDGLEGARRARIAALYTSSFTVGVSLSFVFGRIGFFWNWRIAFILAGMLGSTAVLIAWAALPRGKFGAADRPRPILDLRLVFGNRDALILIFAYFAAIWGSAGLRQWIVLFLAFCASGGSNVTTQSWSMLAVGALINLVGVPAGLLGNELSIRFGLRNTSTLIFLVSALASALFGLIAALPYTAVVCVSLVAGFIAQGNFANLTTGVLVAAAPSHRGASVALYSCMGFGGGFLGAVFFGIALDHFGGASQAIAWTIAFITCGLACLAGSIATTFLSPDIGRARL